MSLVSTSTSTKGKFDEIIHEKLLNNETIEISETLHRKILDTLEEINIIDSKMEKSVILMKK